MKSMPKFKVFRHKLVSLTLIFMLDIGAQMLYVSYMIHDLSSYLDLEKNILSPEFLSVPMCQNQSFSTTLFCLGH